MIDYSTHIPTLRSPDFPVKTQIESWSRPISKKFHFALVDKREPHFSSAILANCLASGNINKRRACSGTVNKHRARTSVAHLAVNLPSAFDLPRLLLIFYLLRPFHLEYSWTLLYEARTIPEYWW